MNHYFTNNENLKSEIRYLDYKYKDISLTLASDNELVLNYFLELFSNISYLTIEIRNDIIGVELWFGFKKNLRY